MNSNNCVIIKAEGNEFDNNVDGISICIDNPLDGIMLAGKFLSLAQILLAEKTVKENTAVKENTNGTT